MKILISHPVKFVQLERQEQIEVVRAVCEIAFHEANILQALIRMAQALLGGITFTRNPIDGVLSMNAEVFAVANPYVPSKKKGEENFTNRNITTPARP